MHAGVSAARQIRGQIRHQLRTLTYVTLDQANGGIVRNLTHRGIAVQAVSALEAGQRLRVRFELKNPRLMVAALGEVMWSTASGQCGIRFLDLSPRMTRQLNEWIFGGLLSSLSAAGDSKFATRSLTLVGDENEDDGLMVSAAPMHVIQLPLRAEPPLIHFRGDASEPFSAEGAELDWLSRPLSGRGLAWTVNALTVLAALLLFAFVFLSVTGQPPRWPFAMAIGATALVGTLYWGFFKVLGGGSLGARLARLRDSQQAEEEKDADSRFR
jgi:hypothetical protein